MFSSYLKNVTGLHIGVLVTVGILAMVAGSAQANSITFLFNCDIQHPPATTCAPGGPFGTLTLTDSVVDPNRVDIEGHFTPGFGLTLERVLLNWNGPILSNHQFFLVAQNAPIGSKGPTIGTALYCDNCQTLGQFAFDMRVSPTDNDLDFAGSLAFFNLLGTPDVPVNLDITSFLATTVPTVGNPGTPPLFAGYRTTNAGGGVGEFWTGATQPVPEPSLLLLLGTGLIGVVGLAARRQAHRRKGVTRADRGMAGHARS